MSKKIARFTQRVDYAERGIMISEDSRTLDACFEMHDGAFVVTALMRRAEESPELSRQIAQMFSIAAASGVTPWHKWRQRAHSEQCCARHEYRLCSHDQHRLV